jgi:NCS1 family nucleobase:cation symporter-1
MVSQAHGFGALMSEKSKFPTLASFLPVFAPAVTAMIGSWATLSLNMPDFTRFGRSQKEQIAGQITALPASMTLFSGMGIVITSAGAVLYPNLPVTQLWDPVTLVGQFKDPLLVAAAMFTIMLSTLAVNVAANLVSPANDLANCFPKWISFNKGAVLTGIIGLLIQPWRLLDDPHAYIFSWLLGYAGGLASIAGVMIADYWIVRHRELKLADLYLTTGEYWYNNGWNWRAVTATSAGCALAWIGLIIPSLHWMYDYSWFIGIASSGGIYIALNRSAGGSPA